MFKSQSLIQRLGFLLDELNIEIPFTQRERLLQQVDKNFCYLGRRAKWGQGGKQNTSWQVIQNIPENEIQAEIQIS